MCRCTQLLSLLLSCTLATVAQGHCGSCEAGGNAAKATAGNAQQCKDGACPIAAAMGKLPKITFAVGEETLPCEKSATAIADKSGGQIRYCVGDEEFDSKSDAQIALVEATERYVSTFAEPQTCETSGKTTVAGTEIHCVFCARSLAKKMNAAMDGVQMTYLVGQEECTCPQAADKLAQEAGVDKQFVVGEEKTCCEHTARLNLAHAKYKAAVAVLEEATAPKDASQKEQGT